MEDKIREIFIKSIPTLIMITAAFIAGWALVNERVVQIQAQVASQEIRLEQERVMINTILITLARMEEKLDVQSGLTVEVKADIKEIRSNISDLQKQ